MIYLNLADDNRILSAQYMSETETAVDSLPEGDITEYRYVKGKFVLDPIPTPPEPETTPTTEDVIEAQVMYTALMTDTLLRDEV